ncbi:DedA family protein/thiosulfate sulfurtransferase GlpE [Variovorax sp.]|uniref:DedA family protein/thiosulfate sulfurtransferase GlpE n=1 Tax=Variovorax sp. TaxID=1871043 RepID=UPI000C4F2398|nr:DedA family protein/thiosulfate sulfurtransferase GlpE [Variovorax sp.]MBS75914.1 sulfurtransferase [Variovorax sp.]
MAQLMSLLVQNAILVVFAASFAARLGLPVPAAAVLVVTGALLAAGDISLAGVVLAAVAANLLGDGAWFYAGRRFGYRFMRLLCRISLAPDSCVRRGESLIGDWGGLSLVAAKFVPGVSVVAPPMAGALGMSVPRFIGFDIGAALILTGLFLGLGWGFRNQIQDVLAVMAQAGGIATMALGALLVVFLVVRWWRRRAFMRLTGMPRISVDELHEMLAGDEPPLVIDVRGAAGRQVDPRRIPGALSYTLKALQQRGLDLSAAAGRDVVLYCNCPNEVSAAQAARVLLARGARRALPLTGGLDAWVASGRPTSPH